MKRQGPTPRATPAQDASPQTGRGHGHTEVSNELLEAVYRFPFTGPQGRLVLFVLRDSYGWKRKVTKARTVRAWADDMNMPRSSADRAIRELCSLSVIEFDGQSGGLALIKNYNAWGKRPQLPLLDVPLADCPTDGTNSCPTGGQNPSTGGTKNPASGTPYGEIKVKKERKGEDPQLLPNQRTDTPTARAELGAHDYPPADHPDFRRLSFKLQDKLTEQWEAILEEARKRTVCRKCSTRPKASDAWAFCRPCTACVRCGAAADGKRTFTLKMNEIVCTDCKETL